jgi:hypothetical protein
MFAARFSSFSSAKRSSWRRSCPKARTTRTPDSVSCRYAVTSAIFSRVARYAPVDTIRNASDATSRIGKVTNVTSARPGCSTNRITVTPISVSDAWNSVITLSVTSWLSASTSFVIREISTPALLRE